MAMPDFLIIGAMKCGTSTLAAQLGAQTGIFVTTPKEPNFFSDDAEWARGIDWYRALFDGAAPGDLKGEASTHYTKLPNHPHTLERLRPHVPAPRLIYLIRNPLDRLVSHYIHEWTMGVITAPLDEALTLHPELVDYGLYGMQIDPWVQAYGREAILIVTNDELNENPQQVLSRCAAHIGYRGVAEWRDLARQNVSSQRIRRRRLDALLIDNPVATFLRRNLVPQWLRDRIKAGRQMQVRPELSVAARAMLEQRFAADRDRLIGLMGDIPGLDGVYPWLSAQEAAQ